MFRDDGIPRFGNNLAEWKCHYIKNIRVKKTLKSYDVLSHEYQLQLAMDPLIVKIEVLCSEISYHAYHFA